MEMDATPSFGVSNPQLTLANAHQKLSRFCCYLAAKAQNILVCVCNLFDSVGRGALKYVCMCVKHFNYRKAVAQIFNDSRKIIHEIYKSSVTEEK